MILSTSQGALGQNLLTWPTKVLVVNHYHPGVAINGLSLLNNQALAERGLSSTPGLFASWPISVSTGSVSVKVAAPFPGPLPLFGAGAALACGRKLRSRIHAAAPMPRV
jgi:hypothetical protein